MKLGMFLMPCHPPERPLYDAIQWDLQSIRWAEELGFEEAWIGEHHTLPWEPITAPDQVLAQAVLQTDRIRLGAAGHLMPYLHPIALANRVSQLDHMSRGRVNFATTISATPPDWELYGVDGMDTARRMAAEGHELILKVWTSQEPFDYAGEFWQGRFNPGQAFGNGPWLRPYQTPHPPIVTPALSGPSPSHERAGERGWWPISFNVAERVVEQHWASYASGAARTGRVPDRSHWRLLKDVFVADTDAEARRWSIDSHLGRFYREYQIPILTSIGMLPLLSDDPARAPEDIDLDYLADSCFLIGSPDTVVERITRTYERMGGFGSLIVLGFDYAQDPERWRRSLELLTEEVMPRVAHLDGSIAVAAPS